MIIFLYDLIDIYLKKMIFKYLYIIFFRKISSLYIAHNLESNILLLDISNYLFIDILILKLTRRL